MIRSPEPSGHQMPQANLERQFILDYLKEKGCRYEDLAALPEDVSYRLMVDACKYASLKLAEIESRSYLRRKIHFDS